MALHQQGRLAEADPLYSQIIAAEPAHRQALRLQGILARQCGEHARSVQLLSRLVELVADDPVPHNELGLTYLASGELYAAQQALGDALACDADNLQARVNLGAVLQRRGYFAAAAEHYATCLDSVPDDLEIHCNLANALLEAGQGERAMRQIDRALEISPSTPALLANRGAILLGLERYADAAAVLEQALALEPADDMALLNLALARRHLDEPAAAAAALTGAVRINPANARAVADLANTEMQLGQNEQALRRCRDFLARFPGERLVLATYSYALTETGEHEQALALQGLDELVTIVDCPAPDGFADLATFNARLADYLLTHESRIHDPVRKATTGGTQTGELDAAEHPLIAAFSQIADAAIEQTVARWRQLGFAGHPVMAYAAEHRALRTWGTVLEAGGAQTPHMHPLGWISGVYYVQLPAGMRANDPAAGALEFGRPPAHMHAPGEPDLRIIEPVAGRLVLFPSWCFHRTLPFSGNGQRISVAFDVVPLAR